MRCPKHKKETVGLCFWCGQQLCPLCIAKEDGRKIYCEKCVKELVVDGR